MPAVAASFCRLSAEELRRESDRPSINVRGAVSSSAAVTIGTVVENVDIALPPSGVNSGPPLLLLMLVRVGGGANRGAIVAAVELGRPAPPPRGRTSSGSNEK